MNSAIDDMIGDIGAAAFSKWESPLPLPAAFAAYSRLKEKSMPQKPESELIIAGVHSCLLATQVLEIDWVKEIPTVAVMRRAALAVLRHWGLELETIAAAPDASPPDAPEGPEPVLRWPPLPPPKYNLPSVYAENLYVVREGGGTAAREPDNGLVVLSGGESLQFLGQARFLTDEQCWLMQMQRSLAAGPQEDNIVWVRSKDVKPGDEIPKVSKL
jgi:hypothetical protein